MAIVKCVEAAATELRILQGSFRIFRFGTAISLSATVARGGWRQFWAWMLRRVAAGVARRRVARTRYKLRKLKSSTFVLTAVFHVDYTCYVGIVAPDPLYRIHRLKGG